MCRQPLLHCRPAPGNRLVRPGQPRTLAWPVPPLQKANRSRGKPLATFQRRKFRQTESGGEVVDDDGVDIDAHESLAAMMAAQVGERAGLGT